MRVTAAVMSLNFVTNDFINEATFWIRISLFVFGGFPKNLTRLFKSSGAGRPGGQRGRPMILTGLTSSASCLTFRE
jgi:hypothetical protein